jgi:transposase
MITAVGTGRKPQQMVWAAIWLDERGHHINTIDWPPYSPDLNSIEHLWRRLKRFMFKYYPQYNNYSRAEEEWDSFCEALKKCWRRIPGKLIRQLILSMPQRLAACRKACGWETKD